MKLIFPRYLITAYHNRETIFVLAVRDIQGKYAGTLGGMFWALFQPVSTIIIYYFVFAVGFRAKGPEDSSFIFWLVCGLIPWFYINEVLPGITCVVTNNSHLVKKTIFPVEILPFVQILSGLFPHIIFLTLLCLMLIFSGFSIGLHAIALLMYYLFCMILFVLGFGWFLSALQVLSRDTSQAVSPFLNLWFWVTPIVWSKTMIPESYRWVLEMNPISFIVEGYRSALIGGNGAQPGELSETIYLGICIFMLIFGSYIFNKLKPQFADVL